MDRHMTFSEALDALKSGEKVANVSWNNNKQYLGCEMSRPEINEKFLYLIDNDGKRLRWHPTQWDLFSEGWVKCQK